MGESETNKRILVIDDDLDIWKAYEAILAPGKIDPDSAGEKMARLLAAEEKIEYGEEPPTFQLEFARQGQEGFERVEEALAADSPFAVAFIDIRMPPGWDGMETAAKIRQIDSSLEIVIVTAYSDRNPEELVRHIGSPDKLLFLRKPFDPEELTQIARSLAAKWNLARQEERQRQELQTVLMTTASAIFTVDPDRRITSWNGGAERITGYSAAEVLGQPCIFSRLSEVECRRCLDGEKVPGDQNRNHELVIRDKEGKTRILSKNATCLRDKKGNAVKIVESFWDVTEIKEAGLALQKSESRFRGLVETTSDWVWETDAEGRFTYCSPICEAIYGFRPEELLGQLFFEKLVPSDDWDGAKLLFEHCVQNLTGFHGVERRSNRKDGKLIYIETSGVPILEEGRIDGFRGIDRDITLRKRTQEEKAKLEEQYRQSQKMEALGTLAGGIAHDLNNILTPIMGNAKLSLLSLDQGSPIYESLQSIDKSAKKASDLVRQILAFSRKQVMVSRVLNLNSVTSDFSKMLTRLIREDIDLSLDLVEDPWLIEADQSQLEQILVNLVVNARDAISQNGKVVIATRNEKVPRGEMLDLDQRFFEGEYMVLSVTDNGSGMDEEMLQRVFDPFYTTKGVGKGTGLGLSMIYGIVKQHQAHIRVRSKPDQGTTFEIYFRRSRKESGAVEQSYFLPVRGGKETILLAEDNAEVRTIISSGLKYYGYQVLEAANGTDAVRFFNERQGAVDLLVTDVVMPGLGGRAVADILKKKQPKLPVIFMSGHPLDVISLGEIEKEGLEFLQKPFDPQDIARKVRQVLDQPPQLERRV